MAIIMILIESNALTSFDLCKNEQCRSIFSDFSRLRSLLMVYMQRQLAMDLQCTDLEYLQDRIRFSISIIRERLFHLTENFNLPMRKDLAGHREMGMAYRYTGLKNLHSED